jgi:hypothetical protein
VLPWVVEERRHGNENYGAPFILETRTQLPGIICTIAGNETDVLPKLEFPNPRRTTLGRSVLVNLPVRDESKHSEIIHGERDPRNNLLNTEETLERS